MKSHLTDIAVFLSYFERVRWRTLRIARMIPEEQVEWRPGSARWSLGDLLRHLVAAERWMFVENACLRPSRYPGHGPELAAGLPAVLRLMDVWHQQSREILGGLSQEDLERSCQTPAGSSLAVWKWLRAMIEHECHHRGQLYVHLTTLGVATPPLFGLTEEEVQSRSTMDENRD